MNKVNHHVMGIKAAAAELNSFPLLLAATVNFAVESSFDAVDQFCIISAGCVLEFVDGARFLVDHLGELRLRLLSRHARVLYTLSTRMAVGLKLLFLRFVIHAVIAIGHSARVALHFVCGSLLTGCTRTTVATCGSDRTCNEHIALLAAHLCAL